MSTPQQVKQALELALSLAENMGAMTEKDSKELSGLAQKINAAIKPSFQEEPTVKKMLKHPVDALLKKGKVELSERRYPQLLEIYDELTTVMKVKFLGAKQNQHVIWFPLEMNGDKSAALFLTSYWRISPLKVSENDELTGEWEGFDLLEQLSSNRPDLDLDDY